MDYEREKPTATRSGSRKRVRVHNPRRKKSWTYRQAAARKDQAERFLRNVLEDDDRADEIAVLSVEDYASERGKDLASNPTTRKQVMRRKIGNEQQLAQETPAAAKTLETTSRFAQEQDRRIHELETANEFLQNTLAEIRDALDCDDPNCDADDHLDNIAEILDMVDGDTVRE